jgi:hypothetical protein
LVDNKPPDKSLLKRDKRIDMTDLDVTAVLRKTEAGVNAIKLRDRALTPRLRMLLITVNGVKTVAELSASMPAPNEALQLLGELMSAEFVCELAQAQPASRTAPVDAKTSRMASNEVLKTAIRRATRLLVDTLGPDAESLCLQIERCTSAAQFNTKISEIARIVGAMRSEKKAAEFLLVTIP